jgi:hypothetical protein
MTNFSSPSPNSQHYLSVTWRNSQTIPDVRFAIRRISLANRIELTRRMRELTLRYEFLKAGDTTDQLEASLSELLVQKLLIEWGLVEVNGLTINGEAGTPANIIENGPEGLSDEIATAVREQLGLSEEERKNS